MTISETREKLFSGDTNLREITEHYIREIESQNKVINAFVSTDFEAALKRADEIQKKIDDGTAGKLAGVVIGVKDIICERGKTVACASKILENFESVYDATVIERIIAEDAIIIGRTNMDEFAMGSTNEYSHFGPVKNPRDITKVPGGSSGGSAASVAAGMSMVSLGSDTGGSVRQPASYCGVVGLKPTYGRISRHGLVAFASSFDCIGPLANSVEDTARLLEVIAGFDERDNTSSKEKVDDYTGAVKNPDKKIKIGVPAEFFGEGLDDEIKQGIEKILDKLEAEGAELIPIHLAHTKYAVATYYIIATAEASSNLARYDGVRFGHRADKDKVMDQLKKEEVDLTEQIAASEGEDKNHLQKELALLDTPLIRLYKQSRTEGFGTEVKRRIMLGTYVLSSGYYDAYYKKAQKVRRLIQDDVKEGFKNVDVIVSPTAPTTAFDLGAELNDPIQMYLNDVYTITANLSGVCGISLPAGTHSNGLPYGIQFMADSFKETKLLNAARLVELISE
ncbi:MAG: amidase family protein [Balneolaceae bacterium]